MLRILLVVAITFILLPKITLAERSSASVEEESSSVLGQANEAEHEEQDVGYCIIRPEEPASPEIYADYNGRRFYFCCQGCRQDFLSDPSRFDSLSPSTDADPDADGASLVDQFRDSREGGLIGGIAATYLAVANAGRYLSDHLHLRKPINALVLGIGVLLSAVLFLRMRGNRVSSSVSRFDRFVFPIAVSMILVGFFYTDSLRRKLRVLSAELSNAEREREDLRVDLETIVNRDTIHYATFLNFGYPPKPMPSKLPPSLTKTYYRGNDERSTEMFNGGNYRTVTFELQLRDSEDRLIDENDSLFTEGQPRELFLHVRMVRSPGTSSGYFTKQYMQRFFLTKQVGEFLGAREAISDRLAWTMVEEARVWEATFPLDGDSNESMMRSGTWSGIVYLCEQRYVGSQKQGARFHYAVEYKINVADGRIQPGSDLWMDATYRGRRFAELQIRPEQWLSTEPLPEKSEVEVTVPR